MSTSVSSRSSSMSSVSLIISSMISRFQTGGSIRSKVPPRDNESAQIKIYCLTKVLDALSVWISDVDGYELLSHLGYPVLPSS
jgi:hypothetical protein